MSNLILPDSPPKPILRPGEMVVTVLFKPDLVRIGQGQISVQYEGMPDSHGPLMAAKLLTDALNALVGGILAQAQTEQLQQQLPQSLILRQ